MQATAAFNVISLVTQRLGQIDVWFGHCVPVGTSLRVVAPLEL
jgi:hypothetical protein